MRYNMDKKIEACESPIEKCGSSLIGTSSVAELSDAERIVLEAQARRDAEKEGDEKFLALATFAGTPLVSPYLSLGSLVRSIYILLCLNRKKN